MQNIPLILLVFAFVFAILASRGWGAPWQLGWLALGFFILSFIFGGVARLL